MPVIVDTVNKFVVGARGSRLVIMNLPALTSGLDTADALNLAAYLVAMSDATREEFLAALDAIENA